MRYWVFLGGKLLLASGISYGLLASLRRWWGPEGRAFAIDLPYTIAVGIWFLICSGIFYLCIWDQRYRCRVCLRRLRMPILKGSWSRMLQLGRPKIEYICPYGHGKLDVAQLQISGHENPEWTPQQSDIWEELFAGVSKGDNEDDQP